MAAGGGGGGGREGGERRGRLLRAANKNKMLNSQGTSTFTIQCHYRENFFVF